MHHRLPRASRFVALSATVPALALAVLATAGGCSSDRGSSPTAATLAEIDGAVSAVQSVEIDDAFWSPRREQIRTVTLRDQYQQLETHHRVENLRIAAGERPGVHEGLEFDDSDVYKWLEAASYQLALHPEDGELRSLADELVRLIAAAQAPDGYLYTFYQTLAPERRWSIPWMTHELYCAGHLIEAGVAHEAATGSAALLGPAIRFADLVDQTFGRGKNEHVPGHPEIELALVKLHRRTGDERYLDLARFFVDRRGHFDDYHREIVADLVDYAAVNLLAERKRGSDRSTARSEAARPAARDAQAPLAVRTVQSFYSGAYFQNRLPLLDTTVAEGHAVRAMYFYAGAAALHLARPDQNLLGALATLWSNTIERRTYLTGGMGSLPYIEGFGEDYELPNASYAESCAAIGSFLFSWRMLLATGDARYADQMERTLYNGLLAGISLDGKHYFYENPLSDDGSRERQSWYTVSCCPPNLARTISSLQRYLFAQRGREVWVHQYVGSRASLEVPGGRLGLRVRSELPWEGEVSIEVDLATPTDLTFELRIPAWATTSEIRVNGEPLAGTDSPEPGTYAAITRRWTDGDRISLHLELVPRLVESPPEVVANLGKAAIVRGPLVYCLEDKDNDLDVHAARIGTEVPTAVAAPALLGGVVTAVGNNRDGVPYTAIPYFAWANRGRSHMEVWLAR